MACSQTLSGITLSCDTSKGGIIEVYIVTWNELSGGTSAYGVSGNVVTAITLTTSATWKKYEFKKNTGSMTSTLNVDDANGVNYVSTDLVLQFNRMETSKRIEMAALSVSDLAVVCRDANNKYWLLGYNEPVSATAGTGQTGTARTDGNFYQITLQANDDSYPMELGPAAIASLTAE